MSASVRSHAVLAVVFVLELIAFGLALGAESRRTHATVVSSRDNTVTYCRYSKDVSTGLGVAAFLFLFIGQMLIVGVTRCLCCSKPLSPGGTRGFAILFFSLSWFSFVIAEIFLLAGATRAAYHSNRTTRNGPVADCESLRKGIFSVAAAFTFFTFLLSSAYYWCFSKAQENNWQYYGGPYGTGPYNRGPYNPGPPGTEQNIGMAAYG